MPVQTTIYYRGIAYHREDSKPIEFYNGPDYYVAKREAERLQRLGAHALIEVETISVTKTLTLRKGEAEGTKAGQEPPTGKVIKQPNAPIIIKE